MKKYLSITGIVVLFLNVKAQLPPTPEENAGVPGAQDVPIDQYLIGLMIVSLLFVAYVIYNKNRNKSILNR